MGDTDTFTVGSTYNISAQVLYNGGPLKSEGVRVYFLASNTSVIPAELGTYVLTDSNGMANLTVTADKTGIVNLTANAMNVKSGVSVEKRFHIVEGTVATPTATPSATPVASPSPSAMPTPQANETVTPAPSITPTATATPTETPTVTPAPSITPTAGETNTQATGIIVAGLALALVLLVLVLIARSLMKK